MSSLSTFSVGDKNLVVWTNSHCHHGGPSMWCCGLSTSWEESTIVEGFPVIGYLQTSSIGVTQRRNGDAMMCEVCGGPQLLCNWPLSPCIVDHSCLLREECGFLGLCMCLFTGNHVMGDGWHVWTESLVCCCFGYAQQSGISMAERRVVYLDYVQGRWVGLHRSRGTEWRVVVLVVQCPGCLKSLFF